MGLCKPGKVVMADEHALEAKVRRIIGEIAKIDPGFKPDADLYHDVGVQSAAGLALLLALEDEFGVTLSDDAFGDANTLHKLVALIKTCGGTAS